MKKYLLIGDLHGCVEEFFCLLDSINFYKCPRKIFSVGDLLDKNPGQNNYKILLKFCKDYYDAGLFSMVLGNHEEKHLHFEDRVQREHKTGQKNQMGPAKNPEEYEDFWATRNQLLELCDEGLDPFKWFSNFPYYYYIKNTNLCIIHGGLEKGKAPENMLKNIICRVRNLCPKTGKMVHLSNISNKTPFWDELYNGSYGKIIFGHAPTREPRIKEHSIGLDTGVVYGNCLTGWLYPEGEFVQIKAQKVYCKQNYGWL